MLYDKKTVYNDNKLRLSLAIIYNYNYGKMYFKKIIIIVIIKCALELNDLSNYA